MPHVNRRLPALCAAGAAALCLPACIIGGASRVETQGTPISSSTLHALETGVTTEKQVLGMLGEPTRSTTDDGTTTHVYEFRKTKHSRGYLLFVFSGRSTEVEHKVAYIQIREGIVQKWWFEGA